jgi:hypothetical protein
MRATLLASMIATIAVAGCRFPWEPEFGPVVGTVRYPNGDPAYVVVVGIVGGRTTLTDLSGRYRLDVDGARDSVTVAANGPTRGAGNPWGSTRVSVRRGRIEADVVLDRLNPI